MKEQVTLCHNKQLDILIPICVILLLKLDELKMITEISTAPYH